MSEITRCAECGHKLKDQDVKRCPKCGARIREDHARNDPDERERDQDEKRRPRKKKARKKATGSLRYWLIGGGVVVGIGVVVLIVILTRRGGDDAIAKKGGTPSKSLVVIDAEVPHLPPPEAPVEPPKKEPVKPPEPPEKAGPPPDWKVTPDIRTAPAFEPVDHVQHMMVDKPILAALDGPFAIFAGKRFTEYPGKVILVGQEKDPEPTPVIDLRTGKGVGYFHSTAPVWNNSRLSPDGLYLVAPELQADSRSHAKDGVLHVWKRDEDKATSTLPMTGIVLWADFIDKEKLGVVTFDQKVEMLEGRALQASEQKWTYRVWDIVNGKTLVETSLEPGDVAVRKVEQWITQVALKDGKLVPTENPQEDELLFGGPSKDAKAKLIYVNPPQLGTLSPGGKYVVLGGRNGVTILAAADGKVVGRQPLSPMRTRLDYRGFGFSKDGRTLYAVVNTKARSAKAVLHTHDRYGLFAWSMEDGRTLVSQGTATGESSWPILPGPIPNTLLISRYLVEAESGLVLAELSFVGGRWLSPGHLLSWGALGAAPEKLKKVMDARVGLVLDRNHQSSWVAKFEEKEVHAVAGAALTAYENRPPIVEANRNALVPIRPIAPAAWAVPPPAAAPPTPTAEWLPAWPDAFAGTSAAIIAYTHVKAEGRVQGADRLLVHWNRHDLTTGKLIDTPILLWPWASRKPGAPWWTGPSITALTPNGERLAMVDPNSSARVDIWDADGKRVVGFLPYGEKGKITWLGFANGRLLTMGGGKLTGWNIPACKAVFEVEGDYTAPAQLPPGAAWVLAATPGHVDVIDTANGKMLGQCEAGRGWKDWITTSLSPDGKTLLRVRHVPNPRDRNTKGAAHLWDMATGKETGPILFGIAPVEGAIIKGTHTSPVVGAPETAIWVSNRRFLGIGPYCHLVDLDARGVICIYHRPSDYTGPTLDETSERPTTRTFSSDPLGGIWVNQPARKPDPRFRLQREWVRMTVPRVEGFDESPLQAKDRTYPFHKDTPLRVEVDLGTHERSQMLGVRAAGLLQLEDYKMTPGGWALRITYEVMDASWSLRDAAGRETVVPYVELRWDLLAPDGKQVWRGTTTHGWAGGVRSKYYVGTKKAPEHGVHASVTNYNFGSKSARDAIVDEILDFEETTQPKEIPIRFPRIVLQTEGTFHPLPKAAELPIPRR